MTKTPILIVIVIVILLLLLIIIIITILIIISSLIIITILMIISCLTTPRQEEVPPPPPPPTNLSRSNPDLVQVNNLPFFVSSFSLFLDALVYLKTMFRINKVIHDLVILTTIASYCRILAQQCHISIVNIVNIWDLIRSQGISRDIKGSQEIPRYLKRELNGS